jgi:hypothetical protein
MPVAEIGCCGAYCRTCRALAPRGQCLGCKLGYSGGQRDINKARCAIKLCCFRDRGYETCADCAGYAGCELIQGFYRKNGYKYRKYRQAIEFIRSDGYAGFLTIADGWRGPYGKY